MSKESIVTLASVSKHYHRGSETVHALQDVSLNIGKGEYVAVLGHSGSGKTTLLNMIGCLDRPTSGTISVQSKRVENSSERDLNLLRRSTIGFIFQQFFLIPTLTVKENVELPMLFNRKGAVKTASELLDIVGLGNRIHHRPGQLSGGEMQRVAIARSLIASPSVLLADEPTGNLDNRNAETIMGLFESLNKAGMTIVVVTHNHDLAARCDRRLLIEDGRIAT